MCSGSYDSQIVRAFNLGCKTPVEPLHPSPVRNKEVKAIPFESRFDNVHGEHSMYLLSLQPWHFRPSKARAEWTVPLSLFAILIRCCTTINEPRCKFHMLLNCLSMLVTILRLAKYSSNKVRSSAQLVFEISSLFVIALWWSSCFSRRSGGMKRRASRLLSETGFSHCVCVKVSSFIKRASSFNKRASSFIEIIMDVWKFDA